MRNLQTGHYTVVTWDKVSAEHGLGDDVFTDDIAPLAAMPFT